MKKILYYGVLFKLTPDNLIQLRDIPRCVLQSQRLINMNSLSPYIPRLTSRQSSSTPYIS